jgi:hypothetical protein
MFGGVDNGLVIYAAVLNDTGASVGTMYRSNWARLNVFNIPVQRHTSTILADGTAVDKEVVTFEMRLITFASDGSIAPVSSWLADSAILVDDPPPPAQGGWYPQLSGDAMRRNLFFLTSPRDGRDFLYVAQTKAAMQAVLASL